MFSKELNPHMKPNIIVALLVGAVVGFGVGSVVSKDNSASPTPSAAAPSAPSAALPQPAAPAAPRAAAPAPSQITPISVPAEAPFFGPKHAKVTVVEWSDFECPFCSRGATVVNEIKAAYPKDVKFVFRHRPLPMHPNAPLAHEASMAAHEQGKFFEYHDVLFANQRALDRASLERYAQQLNLDMAKFKAALDSGKYKSYVQQDSDEGQRSGAGGTPTFFVNGRKIVGAQPFAAFKATIDEELGKADTLLAKGTKIEDVYQKILDSAPPPPKVEVGDAPFKGSKTAQVTIIEWSDFECPFCARGAQRIDEIKAKYGDKVKIAFKHQPLPMHPNAPLAAQASMAAHEQGKFWEYHDVLFANQRALDRASLERYAADLKLDMAKFKNILDTGKYAAYVQKDSQDGMALGATGTPTFFINGQQLVGAQPLEAFSAIIDRELAKK